MLYHVKTFKISASLISSFTFNEGKALFLTENSAVQIIDSETMFQYPIGQDMPLKPFSLPILGSTRFLHLPDLSAPIAFNGECFLGVTYQTLNRSIETGLLAFPLSNGDKLIWKTSLKNICGKKILSTNDCLFLIGKEADHIDDSVFIWNEKASVVLSQMVTIRLNGKNV